MTEYLFARAVQLIELFRLPTKYYMNRTLKTKFNKTIKHVASDTATSRTVNSTIQNRSSGSQHKNFITSCRPLGVAPGFGLT